MSDQMRNTGNPVDMLASFFASTDEEAKKHKGGGGNSTKFPFPLSKKDNCGMLICRMIPDSRGVPVRLTYDIWTQWLPRLKDDGSLDSESSYPFTVPGKDNFRVKLTPEQEGLYDIVVSLMERLAELDYEIQERSQMAYFYAKPIRLIKDDKTVVMAGDNEPVRLFQHNSVAFYQALSDAITLKSGSVGNTFLPNYFSRDPSPLRNIVIVKTSPKDVGYNVSVAFENLETAIGIPLTEEDLKRANDLDSEEPVISQFPVEEFEKARRIMEMICANAEREARATSGAAPSYNPNQGYQPPPPPQGYQGSSNTGYQPPPPQGYQPPPPPGYQPQGANGYQPPSQPLPPPTGVVPNY